MADSNIVEIAKVIYGEGGIFVGKNYSALLAIAQCVYDQNKNGYGSIESILKNNFYGHSNVVNDECVKAAEDVFYRGVRRFDDYDIIEFRSFTKYSDGNGHADPRKCANLFGSYSFLGIDKISDQWGHLYFGYKHTLNPYMVRIAIPDLNIRREPTVNSEAVGVTGIGSFTITEERSGEMDKKTGGIGIWGKLKSGAGWVSLDYCSAI